MGKVEGRQLLRSPVSFEVSYFSLNGGFWEPLMRVGSVRAVGLLVFLGLHLLKPIIMQTSLELDNHSHLLTFSLRKMVTKEWQVSKVSPALLKV